MADLINPAGIPLVNAQTNQQEVVPWDQSHQAVTSGTHNMQAGQSVNVVNPDGALVSLKSEDIPEALQSGYRLPQQADVHEYNNETKYGEGAANSAEAFAAGAARGPSLGLSDVALTKSGLVSPETLDQLQQRHPISSNVGEYGAILAAPEAGLLKGVGILGRATEEAAAPIAARIATSMANPETSPIVAKILKSVSPTAAKTLGSAVEGSVYGLGNQVSESALGDSDFNAENIMHNVGYGALFGGGLGATLGIAGKALEKDIIDAGARDAITENAALHPSAPVSAPTSLEEIQKAVERGQKEGLGDELPAKSRLLETNDLLAGDSQYPAHQIQVESLTDPLTRDKYKTALENPESKEGQLLRSYEAVQKDEGANDLLPKYVSQIAPEGYKPTSDAVEGGNRVIDSFTKQYKDEQASLKPLFKQFDDMAVTANADPLSILHTIDAAIPEASGFIQREPELGYTIRKYEKTMPFSKDTHMAIQDLLTALNNPEGVTVADLRNLRESMRDNVNFLTAPRVSREISNLRSGIMDIMQKEVDKANPEVVEGLNHPLGQPSVRDLFKRYAINEENRSTLEQLLGGSISDKAATLKEIKPEEVLNRIFGNTVYVKAAKEILGDDFSKLASDYLSQQIDRVTDRTKNGFSSNKFATFLKQKGPELEEGLSQHPTELAKIRALTDKMRILPDSPSVNPSGTAKTSLLQKIQGLGSFLAHPTSVPGRLMSALGEHFEAANTRSEFDRILKGKGTAGTPEQLANKSRMYGAYSKIERMTQAVTGKIDRGMKGLFEKAEDVKGLTAQKLIPEEKRQDKYEKIQAHLKDMVANPDKFATSLQQNTQHLNDVAPNINSSLNMAMVRATQFLQSKLPAQNPSSPLTEPYKPSISELSKFNRYYDIVENPLDVLKQLKTGVLTTETLETLQTVYPKLLQQMQQNLRSQLNEKTVAKMPYQSKIMASAFLGEDLSNSLSQMSIASAQVGGPQPQTAGPNAPRPKNKAGPSQKGLGKLDQANQYLTAQQAANQRIERG